MEALMIINSILVAVCLYFIKDFHGDFKEVAKKVGKLQDKVNVMSTKLNHRITSDRKAVKGQKK